MGPPTAAAPALALVPINAKQPSHTSSFSSSSSSSSSTSSKKMPSAPQHQGHDNPPPPAPPLTLGTGHLDGVWRHGGVSPAGTAGKGGAATLPVLSKTLRFSCHSPIGYPPRCGAGR